MMIAIIIMYLVVSIPVCALALSRGILKTPEEQKREDEEQIKFLLKQ